MDLFVYADFDLSGEENMVMDDWMLSNTCDYNSFGFRLYKMDKICTIGRNQRYEDAKELDYSFDNIIRRQTGGGIVEHGNDITYAITIPNKHILYKSKSINLYEELHAMIMRVLNKLRLDVKLNKIDHNTNPKICFNSPTLNDLVNKDTLSKVVGSAIRKIKNGILVQGSLLVNENIDILKDLFLREFVACFNLNLNKIENENPKAWSEWEIILDKNLSKEWKCRL